jgi:putative transposase
MTNHVHFLMTPQTEGGIGYVMQDIGRRYVKYFNRARERTGGLWEGRYRATLIGSERYLLACYRYIELNPVRAGLVAHPRQYRWSSYRANGLGERDPLIVTHERYDALGMDDATRQAAYRALFKHGLDDLTLSDIREATNKSWVLGEISGEAASLLNRRPRPRAAGRPKPEIRV